MAAARRAAKVAAAAAKPPDSPYTAIITGGGIAGLAAAIGLGRRHRVKLLTGASGTSADAYPRSLSASQLDPWIGVWTGGLECAEALSPGLLQEWEKHGCYMGLAGYRNRTGQLLARPSHALMPMAAGDAATANILFVQQSRLLASLRERLPPTVEVLPTNMLEHTNDMRGVTVTTCSGAHVEGDMLIGADGRTSVVRSQMLPPSVSGADCGYPPLCYRGYRVYRGTCPPPLSAQPAVGARRGGGGEVEQQLRESFQSWGGRTRFAAVPVRGGAQSWFATVQGPPIPADGGSGGDGGGSLAVHAVSEAEKGALLSTFEGWHDPVCRLIAGTPHIAVENAWAFGAWPDANLGRCLLIGDAAHTLDPLLAAGAGLALEDAHELSVVIDTLDEGASLEIPGALAWVARRRRARARALSRVGALASAFSHAEGAAAAARDGAMSRAPAVLVGGVFDAIMRIAAGRGTAARAGPEGA